MNRKSFLIGAVSGGLVGVGVGLFLGDEPALLQSHERDATGIQDTVELPVQPRSVRPTSVTAPQIVGVETAANAKTSIALPAAEWRPDTNWFAVRRAALSDEPKDDSWAYFTEQAVSQYLASRSEFSEFTLQYIECRTSVCQIGVESYDERRQPTWSRLMYDMRDQPWYEFGEVGTSSGKVGGRNMTITELRRLTGD